MSVHSYAELKQLVLEKRDAGIVTVELRDRASVEADDVSVVDSFVKDLGFKPLGRAWRAVDRDGAVTLLTAMLARDLAYFTQLMLPKTARYLATSFVDLFDRHAAKCYINGETPSIESGRCWEPLTDSTFDAAVVILDREKIGIVCVEDED